MLQATLTGNVGNDPELKYSANGAAFLRFSVANNYRVRNDQGEWDEAVEWIRVTVFGQRAESLGQYLHKGMRVTALGRLEARPWVDNNDNVRAGLEMTAVEIDFQSTQNGQGGQQSATQPQQARQGQQRPQQRQQGRPGAMNEWQAAHGDVDQVPF